MSEQLQLRRGTASQVAAFTGAQGELAVDITNNRLVLNDGATQGGWAHALATRSPVSDAAYSAVVTDRLIAYTALTAGRIVTLPSAASFPTGAILTIVDETGNCSGAKAITLARAGSDTIDGASSAVIASPYGAIAVESNGANAWTVTHAGAFGNSRTPVSDAAYSAVVTDRLIAYTALTAARIVTLPAAAAFPAGVALTIIDEAGACTPTNTIAAARAGSDTISGATSAVIAAAYGSLKLESNGANAWTVVDANNPAVNRGGPCMLGQSRIPFILCSSGTMGNNGALTGLTSLPATYGSAYIWMPSGAIASGSAAGWYYFVGSSATTGTVYNNSYSSGTPAIPASPTAFSTTGPGAFTQTTGSFVAAYTLAIPGNALGINGAIELVGGLTLNASTNAKTFEAAYGSYIFGSNAISASGSGSGGLIGGVGNRGVTNSQAPLTSTALVAAASSTAATFGAIDSTQSQNLTISLKLANATDFIVLESIVAKLLPGVP
jgi:hypothetical protein